MNKSSCGFLLVLATSTQVTTSAKERVMWPQHYSSYQAASVQLYKYYIWSVSNLSPNTQENCLFHILSGLRRDLTDFSNWFFPSSKHLQKMESLKPGSACRTYWKTCHWNGDIHDCSVKIPKVQQKNMAKKKNDHLLNMQKFATPKAELRINFYNN